MWSTKIDTGSTSIIDVANSTIARLQRVGIDVLPGSRLIRSRSLIQEIQDTQILLEPDDQQLLERVAEAHLTITDQHLITRVFCRDTAEQPVRDKLIEMLTGAEVGSQDSNPIGRNTQFELKVAAMLMLGGATVGFIEPDIELRIGSLEAGIACKRLTSANQFKRRVRAGEKQLERQGDRGFVAVNIDAFVKRVQMADLPPDGRAHEFIEKVGALNRTISTGNSLLGVLYFGHTTEYDFTGPKPKVQTYNLYSFQLIIDDDSDAIWQEPLRVLLTDMQHKFGSL